MRIDQYWRYDLLVDLAVTAECRLCGIVLGPAREIKVVDLVRHTDECLTKKRELLLNDKTRTHQASETSGGE